MLFDLSKLFIQSLLTRHNKDLKPALQVLRHPQAPHTRGFLLGVPDQFPPQCPCVNGAHGWRDMRAHRVSPIRRVRGVP